MQTGEQVIRIVLGACCALSLVATVVMLFLVLRPPRKPPGPQG